MVTKTLANTNGVLDVRERCFRTPDDGEPVAKASDDHLRWPPIPMSGEQFLILMRTLKTTRKMVINGDQCQYVTMMTLKTVMTIKIKG